MAKVIYTGPEDCGKSYQLALMTAKLVERNAKWLQAQDFDYKKLGPKAFFEKYGSLNPTPRPIRSNLRFAKWFEYFATERGIPIIYWTDIADWVTFAHCDMVCDEIGAYLDSRTFKDLPLDVRLWLAQASKLGVDIYGSAQDFAQVDISFRRLVQGPTNALYLITKLIGSQRPDVTRPVVDRVWGICMKREIDPVAYDENSKKFSGKGIMPGFFFLRKEICTIFDTTERIAKSKPPPYKHIERKCVIPGCRMERHIIREDGHYQVTHV